MNIYFLEFILTTKCNQQCSYCNVFDINKNKTNLEVDLDFLKYILKNIPDNTMIEFCGGEPGIIPNLNDVFNITNSNKKVKAIQIMSNGLVRKNNYDWLTNNNVWYYEHLIKDLDGKDILKFYNDLDFIENSKWKYIIVTTKKTINSLLLNFDYYKSIGLFSEFFWYKIMNPKVEGIELFSEKVKEFFNKLKEISDEHYIEYTLDRIDSINNESSFNIAERLLCGKNSPQPTIDFETKELVHCGAFLEHSSRVPYNKDNFLKHLKCNMFIEKYDYCKTCYIYAGNKTQSIISCKKENFYNFESRRIDEIK